MKLLVLMIPETYELNLILLKKHLFAFRTVLIMVVVEQQMKFVTNQQKLKQKTTVFGLFLHAADFAMLCVDASSSVVDTTREHFSYAITLNVPIFVVINKIDLCSKTSIQQTITCLISLHKHGNSTVKREPYVLEKDEDLVKPAEMFGKKSICSIFAVSSVTGENINLLKRFLNILPPKLNHKEQERLSQLPVGYRIDDIYTNNPSSTTIVSGILHSTIILEGESFLVGPLLKGTFLPADVTSIHRYRVPRRMIHPGQAATLSLPQIGDSRLRKVDNCLNKFAYFF